MAEILTIPVKAIKTVIHEGIIYNMGDTLRVPITMASTLKGIEIPKVLLDVAEFKPLSEALDKAKAGETVNTNPIKSELIVFYASSLGINIEDRSKADIFDDICEKAGVKKNDNPGKSKK